jgi:hypothetical protein
MLTASAFGLLAFMTWQWEPLVGALFFGWPVQSLIRMMGREDPQWTQIYRLARAQPLIREPHGLAFTREVRPPRILPKPSKWLK